MFIKLLIISIIIVAIFMLGLGIKLLFNPKAKLKSPTCALEDDETDGEGACYKCQLKDLTDCPDNKKE